MIPRAYIDEWRQSAPWNQDTWVEQDLVVSRAIVEIFRGDGIAESLAFRGGTALYKLHLEPARYSEDIDLVQIRPEPIGSTFDEVRRVLDPWLGELRNVYTGPRIDIARGGSRFLLERSGEDARFAETPLRSSRTGNYWRPETRACFTKPHGND